MMIKIFRADLFSLLMGTVLTAGSDVSNRLASPAKRDEDFNR